MLRRTTVSIQPQCTTPRIVRTRPFRYRYWRNEIAAIQKGTGGRGTALATLTQVGTVLILRTRSRVDLAPRDNGFATVEVHAIDRGTAGYEGTNP